LVPNKERENGEFNWNAPTLFSPLTLDAAVDGVADGAVVDLTLLWNAQLMYIYAKGFQFLGASQAFIDQALFDRSFP